VNGQPEPTELDNVAGLVEATTRTLRQSARDLLAAYAAAALTTVEGG
jgi:hypothetical protein